jgi:hypothetical protein
MNINEANAIVRAFEKRYPFMKVTLNRTGSGKLLTRALTECHAKKISGTLFKRLNLACISLALALPRNSTSMPNS